MSSKHSTPQRELVRLLQSIALVSLYVIFDIGLIKDAFVSQITIYHGYGNCSAIAEYRRNVMISFPPIFRKCWPKYTFAR